MWPVSANVAALTDVPGAIAGDMLLNVGSATIQVLGQSVAVGELIRVSL
jgi:hypothetical protein